MSCYRIRTWPDPALRRPARRLTETPIGADGRIGFAGEITDPRTTMLAAQLTATMHAHHGVGIAAPQVGISLAICVVHPPGRHPRALINPVMRTDGTPIVDTEGCLSLPGHPARVARAPWAEVSAFDPAAGELVHIEAEGLEARILQHEIDHLDGRLIVHRVVDEDRPAYQSRLRCALMGLPDDDIVELLAQTIKPTGPAETTTRPQPETTTRPAPSPPRPAPPDREAAA